jgi:thiol-disulfide isomerase/thioredoxin
MYTYMNLFQNGSTLFDSVLPDDLDGLYAPRPVVVVVWDAACPASRYALPFFERLQERYPGARVVGVAKGSDEETRRFLGEHGIRFPQTRDESGLLTSLLGVSRLPACFVAMPNGEVRGSEAGCDVPQLEAITRMVADMTANAYRPLVAEHEEAPAFMRNAPAASRAELL